MRRGSGRTKAGPAPRKRITGRETARKRIRTYAHRGNTRISIPTEQTERDADVPSRDYRPKPGGAASAGGSAGAGKRPAGDSGAGDGGSGADSAKNTAGCREPHLSWDRRRREPGMERAHALHIREKFSPQDMISKLSRHHFQTRIFDTFNGFEPGAKYRYYHHKSKGNWQNRMIRGDSARVMASLAAHENYAGSVQTIFFDPPYGINFDSNFAYAMRDTRKSKNVKASEKFTKDPVTCEAFCDTWERGLDSYLDAMLHRLCIMRDLLTETCSIFVQISSANVHRMALLLDEVFGHDNAVSTIMFRKAGGTSSSLIPEGSDFLLWYAKDKKRAKYRQLYELLTTAQLVQHMSSYAMVEDPDGNSRSLTNEEKRDVDKIPGGFKLFQSVTLTSQHPSLTRGKDYTWNGVSYTCGLNRQWGVSCDALDKLAAMNRLVGSSDPTSLRWKQYADEIPGRRINNQWTSMAPPQDTPLCGSDKRACHREVHTDDERSRGFGA